NKLPTVGRTAVVLLLTACVGRAAHSDDREPQPMLPADQLLRELTREEKKELCRETETLKEYRPFTCNYHVMFELAAQRPTTDAEAQAAREAGYDSCLKRDLCAEVPVFVDDCPVNVEQYQLCAVEQS